MNNSKELDIIIEKIQKVNPAITTELLDLAYDYIKTRWNSENSIDAYIRQLNSDDVKDKLNKITTNLLHKKFT